MRQRERLRLQTQRKRVFGASDQKAVVGRPELRERERYIYIYRESQRECGS